MHRPLHLPHSSRLISRTGRLPGIYTLMLARAMVCLFPLLGKFLLMREADEPLPFIEVFVDIPVSVAEQRDPKGLYKKARAGEIPNFTGISAPYEEPEKAEIHLRTDKLSVEECVQKIVEYLEKEKLLKL